MTTKNTKEQLIEELNYLRHQVALNGSKDVCNSRNQGFEESDLAQRSILLAAPIGIGLVSDRIIKRVNPRLCEMLGYGSEELIGQSARIFYVTDEEFEFVGKEKYAQISKAGNGKRRDALDP